MFFFLQLLGFYSCLFSQRFLDAKLMLRHLPALLWPIRTSQPLWARLPLWLQPPQQESAHRRWQIHPQKAPVMREWFNYSQHGMKYEVTTLVTCAAGGIQSSVVKVVCSSKNQSVCVRNKNFPDASRLEPRKATFINKCTRCLWHM